MRPAIPRLHSDFRDDRWYASPFNCFAILKYLSLHEGEAKVKSTEIFIDRDI